MAFREALDETFSMLICTTRQIARDAGV